ncbi:four helix bundle protein [Patescibacteria group bacterium]|nr:four helix bundle protein [Patescibacteria group bacterium]
MEDPEKYKKEDGSIDWGKFATAQLANEDSFSEKKKTKQLEDLAIFKTADEVSDYVWDTTSKWDWFAKKTIGSQIVRSADSVGANIAEGYGRYFFKEYMVFLYYARGSLYETQYWIEKARKRGLIDDEQHRWLKERTDKLPMEINKVIKIIKREQQKWKNKGKNH